MEKQAAYDDLYFQKVGFTAQALDDGVYSKTSQISFDAKNIVLDSGQHLNGKLQLGGFGMNAVFEGDVVHVSGKLYPGYGAYQGRVSFAQLELLRHHPTVVSTIRRKFTAGMQSALPEPLAPFAMGLLVGQRATLPDSIKKDLLMVGLTHIIAVSGYNLTIILHASKRLLGRRSKRVSTWLAIGLIGIFLLLSGASASIVRAAIVSMLSIAASYYGRAFRPLNLILFAACITVWANPHYLWSDISWYLSFLAFFGVMILAPLVGARLPERARESIVIAVAIESICAETMTLPYVLHTFGQMPRIGLLANVLVVSFIPLAMLLATIAGLAGMFIGPLAGWVAWPAKLLLMYMLDVAHILARVPGIFVEHIGLSLTQMISLYVMTCLAIYVMQHKTNKPSYDKITDRNIITVQGAARERTQ